MKNLSRLYYYFKWGGVNMLSALLMDKLCHADKRSKLIYDKSVNADPDEYEYLLGIIYGMRIGKKLNLQAPVLFNEKIQWLKLYDSTPVKTELADKYRVRSWVADKIGEQYLIPLLGVWERFDKIDFDTLPDAFVLKANHASGCNIIVESKRNFNQAEARKKFEGWLSTNFAFSIGFELHYSNIQPKIIAEEYIKTERGSLADYKVHCFNGKPLYIQVICDRNYTLHTAEEAFYDTEWNLMDFTYTYPHMKKYIERPKCLAEMLRSAEKLSSEFPYVRVDFYELDHGVLKFGEMTFTPASGLDCWNPSEADLMLGSKIELPLKLKI